MAQMEEQNKTPEKELNKMEITNLSDAELKTLVIRMLTEMVEYTKNIREEMKIILSEIKIYREPRVERIKWRIKLMIWNNQNRMKKQEFKKMRRGLGTSGTTLNII